MNPRQIRIAYAGGGWASNIGNSFYNIGALHVLRTIVGAENVFFVPDVARWTWESSNAYDVLEDVDADIVVFSGPYFSDRLVNWQPLFQKLVTRGIDIGFLSVGQWDYSAREQAIVQRVLDELGSHLRFIATRDAVTYRAFQHLRCPSYDGICTSMFLDEALTVTSLQRSPYVVFNFDRQEPNITWYDGEVVVDELNDPGHSNRVGRVAARLARRNRFVSSQPAPLSVGPYDVVRTQSAAFTDDAARLFPRPNTHYSDVPQGYLAIYKSAEAVYTNRVHTTAATLILGGTARFVPTSRRSSDGRWYLFDRLGVGDVRQRALKIDRDVVRSEKHGLVAFLRDAIGAHDPSSPVGRHADKLPVELDSDPGDSIGGVTYVPSTPPLP